MSKIENKTESNARFFKGALLALACATSLGLAACEKEGPLERAGEEIDEAIDTVRDGEESTANKVDDAIDELKD